MKILLSAYVFAPIGSEPAIGWNWAISLVKRGHEVWVLAREQVSRENIEAYAKDNDIPDELHIIYVGWPYDLKKTLTNRLPMNYYWHYFAWQKYAAEEAARLHEVERFDVVQHITWGSLRSPSQLGALGIPFIFGPVAGGERTPKNLRGVFELKGQIEEFVRDKTLQLHLYHPGISKVFAQAHKICVTSDQTKELVPRKFHDKTVISLAIGFADEVADDTSLQEDADATRLLFVGRFLNWKGMSLGLRAFALAHQQCPKLRLTMVGKGPEGARWRQLAKSLGIAEQIDWIDWVDQKKLQDIYQDHDLFLFPSFHDSGGMVILEAMSMGLPVVCLNLGGPGVMVNDHCGKSLETSGKSSDQVVRDMADTLVEIALNPKRYQELSKGALRRVRDFTWDKVVGRVYEEFEQSTAKIREKIT